jgi:methylmalonyl-CoA mutase cobalamin-binding subunit
VSIRAEQDAAGRRPRRSVLVLAGNGHVGDDAVTAVARSLRATGTELFYLGREDCSARIAAAVADMGADAVEVCIAGNGGVLLIRQLLRELDRNRVSIVVHRLT